MHFNNRNTMAVCFAIALLGGVLVLGLLPTAVVACPMCSESLPSGAGGHKQSTAAAIQAATLQVSEQNQSDWAQGFYYSILLMLAVPFSVVAGLGGLLYWSVHRCSWASPTPFEAVTSPRTA